MLQSNQKIWKACWSKCHKWSEENPSWVAKPESLTCYSWKEIRVISRDATKFADRLWHPCNLQMVPGAQRGHKRPQSRQVSYNCFFSVGTHFSLSICFVYFLLDFLSFVFIYMIMLYFEIAVTILSEIISWTHEKKWTWWKVFAYWASIVTLCLLAWAFC